MTIRSGQLRHRIRIEKRDASATSSGAPTLTWSLHAEVWASVEPLMGKEFLAAQERAATVTTRFRLRHLPGVKPAMRIVWDGRWFDIRAVQQVAGLNVELIIMADEQVARPL